MTLKQIIDADKLRNAGFTAKDLGDWNLLRGGLFRGFVERRPRKLGVDVKYHLRRGRGNYLEASQKSFGYERAIFSSMSDELELIFKGVYKISKHLLS